MRAFMLLFLVGCSSFDPSDPWAQFPVSAEYQRELAEYEEEDLKTLLDDVDGIKHRRKHVKVKKSKVR